MHWYGKVVWSEGMFLRCQHFQQQDRYLENLVRGSVVNGLPFPWGVRRLVLDAAVLERGRIAVVEADGILPDGTPFNVPKDQDAPPALALDETTRDETIYLCLPVDQAGKAVAEVSDGDTGAARFQASVTKVADCSDVRTGSEADIRLGHLCLRLMQGGDDRSGYFGIPVARIRDVSANGKVTLDKTFIPTCLSIQASDQLRGFVVELQGLLHQRGDALAKVDNAPERQGTVADHINFMLLQLVNRHEPVLTHLAGDADFHPEALFRLYLQLAGELATFFSRSQRPPEFPAYRHDDLTATFEPLEATIREFLSVEFEKRAIQIPLQAHPEYGLYVGKIEDRSLLSSAAFVLAVTSDLDAASMARQFPDHSKTGAVEQIQKLVNLALLGIPLRPRPTAPRQINYNINAAYFELDKTSEHWSELEQSGGIAFFVAGKFPNLKLELWAIRPVGQRHA